MGSANGKLAPGQSSAPTLITPDQAGKMGERGDRWPDKASNYYNMHLVNKAHWSWKIIVYFFFGGIAGGSFLVSTIASLLDSEKNSSIIRTGRYLSFVSLLISPVLLIADLGRPLRFVNMLRVMKLRSVMSIGTWALSFFGVFCSLATMYQAAQDGLFDWFPPVAKLLKVLPVKLIGIIGSFFGMIVASYTGVLLAATAVPIWAKARSILGPLFFTSGLSTALAAISLILSFGRQNSSLERLENAEIIAATTELGLISALAPTLGPLGKPLFKGQTGTLFLRGTVGSGLVAPLLLRLVWRMFGKSTPRPVNIIASLLVLIGGLILRFVWIDAGRKSADDPQATHYYNQIEWKKRKQS